MSNEIEKYLVEMEKNRSAFNSSVEAIRQDTRYSDNDKADLLASEYEKAKGKHEAIRNSISQAIEDTRTQLEKSAFVVSKSDEANYRAIISRVSSITDKSERARIFELAEKTNDMLTIQAIATVEHADGNWSYMGKAAEHDKDIARLIEHESNYGALRTGQKKFTDNMAMHGVNKPQEASRSNASAFRNTSR